MTTNNIEFYPNQRDCFWWFFAIVIVISQLSCQSLPIGTDVPTQAISNYQKIDIAGNTLPINAENWACIADIHKNLLWEVKTKSTGLRSALSTYSWFDPNSKQNGGFVGYPDRGNCIHSGCDSHAYIDAVNNLKLCGVTSWRLPTREELRDIVMYKRRYPGPTIDSHLFPNTQSQFYWSLNTDVDDPESAWGIGFAFGFDYAYRKESFGFIRLVAELRPFVSTTHNPMLSGQHCREVQITPSQEDRFVLQDDGTLIERFVGLQWMRCAIGQQWQQNTCMGDVLQLKVDEAENRAANFKWASKTDWRLPTIKELAGITELNCYNPATNVELFPLTAATNYWSSTAFVNNPVKYWVVNFYHGEVQTLQKSSMGAVRLVRSVDPDFE